MRTPLAWRNVTQSRTRSLVALTGISFALLLIFMQLGFYAAAGKGATQVHDALDFDLLIISPEYVFVAQPARFPRDRLEQVRAVGGVVSVTPIWLGLGEWRNPESRERWNILSLGVEPGSRPFLTRGLNDEISRLTVADTALADSISRPEHGRIRPGVRSEVEDHRIRIVGDYAIGAGFVAGATMITGRDTFLRLFREGSADEVSLGLVKLAPGTTPERTAAQLRQILAPAATVLTRSELTAAEQTYWLRVKPIGLMFTSGVMVAFMAGGVILYQVLASEVQNRLREYATLRALGYGDRYVYGIVLRQALIFSGTGFLPALCLALGLYFLLRTQAFVPVTMEFTRVAGVLLLALTMSLGATYLAIRKLRAADPADLF